jgi:hypothetical protein
MDYKQITTEEAAAAVHGRKINALTPENLTELGVDPKFQDWLIANYKLAVITEALNTDDRGKVWEPDWSNRSQWKYWPWFEIKADKNNPSGSYSHVGSRLCLETRDKVSQIQKYFKNLHIDQHLIRNK